MSEEIRYQQEILACQNPHCRRCRTGKGHGPYWYAYRTENERTTRTYIGKKLPSEQQPSSILVSHPERPLEEQTSVNVRILVLGQFRMERRSGQTWHPATEDTWQTLRVRSLLSLLLSTPGRRLGREQIMDALWPEDDIDVASHRLDRGVYSLRQVLEPSLQRLAHSQLLRLEQNGVMLADQTHIWIDADAFEQLMHQAHVTDEVGKSMRCLEEAAALYTGDFLPAEQHDWVLVRREGLHRAWIGGLLELADLHIARTAFAHAIEPLDRLLATDPSNEAAVQRLIISLAQLDRRGEALRVYQQLADVLQRDHLVPLPETQTLYEAVRLGRKDFVSHGMRR